MPSALTYPGVYIEEIPSGVRTITGVATSITAFVGSALRGPLDASPESPVRVQSFAGFERTFGGLSRAHPMSYAVDQFFRDGGGDALIVRVANGGAAATGAADTLNLIASSSGEWGERLRVRVDHATRPEIGAEQLFNLAVRDAGSGIAERFLNVSVLPAHPRFVGTVLAQASKLVRLVRLVVPVPVARPGATPKAGPGVDPLTVTPGSLAFNADGDDGAVLNDAQVSQPALQAPKRGLSALERADLFNLMCVPLFSLEAIRSRLVVIRAGCSARTRATVSAPTAGSPTRR